MNAYETKRQTRLERIEQAATKAREESEQTLERARKMADVIPLGQPILVDHYSARSDRNYRDRIHNTYKKGFELSEKADRLERRAEAIKNNKVIFSDDPNASEKLEEKLSRLEQKQTLMVEANKLIRKNDRERLLDLGFSDSEIDALMKPDFCGRIGFADYQIKNNRASINATKERIEILAQHANDQTSEKVIKGVRVVDNVEDNRFQMFFPGKPSSEIIDMLKHGGFRWSPSNGCWQAYRNNSSIYNSERILEKVQL